MRLTNVAQVALPAGRVRSFALPALPDAPPARLPISFDQRRHVGEGDRPGSWMAIAARLPADTSLVALGDAWTAVVRRHGSLQTAFRTASDGLVLETVEIGAGVWEEHRTAPGELTRDVLRDVFDRDCRPFARPSHRLCVVEPEAAASDRRPVVIIGADHAHVDMWSLQVLVRDLLQELADPGSSGRAAASSFAEHTALLEAAPPAPEAIRARWSQILDAADGRMPVFPLPLGDLDGPRGEVVVVRDVLGTGQLRALEERGIAQGVRLIAVAMSVVTEVMARTAGAPLRAVFPVHSRAEPRWHDAVGWFITNAVLECDDPAPAACAAAVREAIGLGSHPLAPILAPYGGMPATPGMFALSWLDARRLPVQLDASLDPQFVSAVVPTDGVMIWFIVTPAGLQLRCRYPDTPEARVNVGGWIDEVQDAFVRAAAVVPSVEHA